MASKANSEADGTPFRRYKKRSGTTDQGKEYEYLMCAYFSLKLCDINNIVDFELTTNNEIYGDFDDLSIKVTYEDRQTCTYLLQLKHSTNRKKKITDTNLCSEKKKEDFYLGKYLRSFNSLNDRDDVTCILYTNTSTAIKNGSKLYFQSRELDVEQITSSQNLDLFNTSGQIFHFRAPETDCPQFFEQFYFYAGQKNVEKIKTCIRQFIDSEIYDGFIQFMRSWWSNNFVLSRRDVLVKLSELALSPFAQVISSDKSNEKTKTLTKAIMEFEMTFVEDLDEDIVIKIWPQSYDVDNINLVRSKYGLSQNNKSKVMWYLDKVPLIIKITDSNQNLAKFGIKTLEKLDKKKKIVILGDNLKKSDFPKWSVFENVHDLLGRDVGSEIQKLKMSLQGRKSFEIQELIDSDKEIAKIFGVRELLLMTQGPYNVGDSKVTLPEFYIPRNISATSLDIKKLLNFIRSTKSAVVIINCDTKFKKLFNLSDGETTEIADWCTHDYKRNRKIILSSERKCDKQEFDEIASHCRSTLWLVQNIDDRNCILLETERIKPNEIEKLKNGEIIVGEDSIFSIFDCSVNVVCATSGIGKSTLIRKLITSTPSSYISISVSLIKDKTIFGKKYSNDEIWYHLLEQQEDRDPFFDKIKMESEQFYVFLDGLDEIDDDTVDTVLNFVRYTSSKGINVWITSRLHLKEKIIKHLNVLPLNLQTLSKEEQEEYICNRLQKSYKPSDCKNIAHKIFSSVNIINSQKLLGIPLQLYVITENLRNNKTFDLREEIFIVTKMYRVFFEGKRIHWFSKLDLGNQLVTYLDNYLELYEVPALKSCLSDDTFKKLGLNSQKTNKFIESVKLEGDKLGIISRVDEAGEVVFTHQTYAEYFASVWLRDNLKMVRLLQKDLFEEKCENLKLMFDIIMAEENPLLLGIIYGDRDLVEKFLHTADMKDSGGRSALHFICSYSKKCPELRSVLNHRRVRVSRRRSSIFFDVQQQLAVQLNPNSLKPNKNDSLRLSEKHYTNSDLDLQKIFELSTNDIFEEDFVFRWTCIDYAIHSQCLFPIDKLLEKHKNVNLDNLFSHYDLKIIAFYAAQLRYPNLLRKVIHHNPYVLHKTFSDDDITLLHMAVIGSKDDQNFEKHQRFKIIDLLIQHGIDINSTDSSGRTPLHIASEIGNFEAAEYLLKCGVNVNFVNRKRRNPLHVVKHSCIEVSNLMIKSGVNINAKDFRGATPLHLFSKRGDYENVKLLIDMGANVESNDNHRRNVLHYAIDGYCRTVELVRLLINEGVNINAQDEDRVTPLYLAIKKEDKDLVKLLVEQGADVNSTDKRKRNLLFYASIWGVNIEVIKILIDHGLDITTKNISGVIALHYASQFGHYNLVKLLLEKGVNINATTDNLHTPLHFAGMANRPNANVISLLIDSGADTKLVDIENRTALSCAIELKMHYENIKVFFENTPRGLSLTPNKVNCLHLAVYSGNVKVVQLLLDSKVDLEEVELYDEEYPLYFAVIRGKLNKELLSRMTAFIYYSGEDDSAIVRHLLLQQYMDFSVHHRDLLFRPPWDD